MLCRMDAMEDPCCQIVFAVFGRKEPMGDGFQLLGVAFDEELSMSEAVSQRVLAAGWKLRTLTANKILLHRQ